MIGGIASVDTLATTTAFTASQSELAVTLSGDATATVDTDGSGDITAVNITSAGTGYTVGDIVTVTEVGGTPGVGSFRVATVS